MREFIRKYEKECAIAGGILICLAFYFINPFGLAQQGRIVLSVASLMISWWIFDAMPLAVVALLPILIFPLLHISSMREVTSSYADSVIFLFMGGFFIALAIEKWELHKRLALSIILMMGTNGNRIILGFIIATGLLSLWLSNTATTMMMFPIATSVIYVMESDPQPGANYRNFSLALMLSIAYASNFALGTIIGSPPNVAYVAYIHEKFNYTISFSSWLFAFLPLTICMMAALYFILVKVLFPNRISENIKGKETIREDLKRMGPLSIPEKRVLGVFIITVFLWITKDIINELQGRFALDDTIIAIFGGTLLFIIPAGRLNEDSKISRERLLTWQDTRKLAWGILLLFGGGIALAKALEQAKLIDQLGKYLANYSTSNVLLMVLIVSAISIFMSEVMSNVAQVIVMAPVISSLAVALKMDPLLLGMPMTLAASSASMLPMGTPPNAIVFASGHIRLRDMLKAGFVLNLISILLISLFCYFLQPFLMKIF